MTRLRFLHLVLLAAVAALAGLAFQPVFADAAFGSTVVAAAIGSVGLWAVMAVQWPKRQGVSMVVSLLGLLLLLANTVLSETAWLIVPTPETVTTLFSGLINGWDRLLTTDIPVAGTTSLVVLAPTLTWLAGFVSAELAFRTTSSMAPVLPGLLVFGAGVFFSGADSGDRPVWLLVFVLLAFALVLLRQQRPSGSVADLAAAEDAAAEGRLVVSLDDAELAGGQQRSRPLVLGAGFVVVAVLVAAMVVPRLPFASAREPYDPRAAEEDDPAERDDLSPLVQLKSFLTEEPARPVFTVRPDGEPRFWRLLVLDDFDGEQWRSSAVYQNAGTELPESGVPGPTETERLVQQVEIDELPGPWLPAAVRPTAIRPSDDFQAQVDPETGTVVAASEDVSGLSYTVESEVPVFTLDELRGAAVSDDPALRPYIDLPEPTDALPQEIYVDIRDEALAVTAGATSPYRAMRALESYFRSGVFDYDDEAPSGHSYGHLWSFLFGEAKQGSAEHFAAAFAVMARAAGYPARLSVGFVPGGLIDGDRYQVRTDHAHAWPEVYFEDLGWVPFEPNPRRTALDESEVAQAEAPPAPVGEEDDGAAVEGATSEDATTMAEDARSVVRIAAIVLAVLVGIIVLVGVLLAGFRARRRARRRRGTPNDQVVGAYQEALDQLSVAGLRRTQHMTGAELAAISEQRFSGVVAQEAGTVATLANEALFARRPVGDERASLAWDTVGQMSKDLRRHRSIPARAVGLLDPRPLVRRR